MLLLGRVSSKLQALTSYPPLVKGETVLLQNSHCFVSLMCWHLLVLNILKNCNVSYVLTEITNLTAAFLQDEQPPSNFCHSVSRHKAIACLQRMLIFFNVSTTDG